MILSFNSQPWRFTNNSLGLPRAHSLSDCLSLWVCVVCLCFFSTCVSTCVTSAAWFVFGFVFITTFLFSVFFLYEFNRYLCHGAVNPAPISVPFFYLHVYCVTGCVCVSKHVYAVPSYSIFVHIYCHMFFRFSVLYLYPSFCCLSSFSET